MKKLIIAILLVFPMSALGGEVVKGLYISAFERSEFIPCGSKESWWLTGPVFLKIESFIKENSLRGQKSDWHPNKPVYVELIGIKSKKGKYGHMGAYTNEFTAFKALKIDTENACPK